MVLPLDDILKAISRGGGAGAQIAQKSLKPTGLSALGGALAPTAGVRIPGAGIGMGKFAGKGLLEGYKPPQTSQHERREGPGGLFGAALTAIDLGRGIMTSTIKESIDFLQGEGINPGEWWNQATTQYGFGELIHDERDWVGGMMIASSPFTGGVGLALGAGVLANNIWADRVIGFIGDVAVDPLMYMGGFGAFARGAGYMGAISQLGDVARVAQAAGKMTAAKKVAIDAATLAAGSKKSLSAASRELAKHGDVGKALIKELGWSPGLRLRAPMTGPGGRMLRKVGGAGDRVWDVGSRLRGKPSWITANRVKQIPKYYDDLFDKRTLTEMVEAFGKGRKATAEAVKKFEREFAKKVGPVGALDKIATLERVAGQAAKAPLEIALPGLRFGRAAGVAGLGGRFISQVADAPIRGTHLATTQKARDKVALLFDPQGKDLRAMFEGGRGELPPDAGQVAVAVGIRNAQRFAAGRAKFAERDINAATQKALAGIKRKGISDSSARRLEAALRGKDGNTGRMFAVRGELKGQSNYGTVTDIDSSTNWFRNLPEDLQGMYRTDREKFMSIARAIDQRLDTVEKHVFTAYGDDFGDDVLRKEGSVYSGHRQINRDFQQAITGEEPPKLQGKRGYPVRGRAVPGSVKEREYFTGGPLKIEEPKLLPPVAEGRLGVVQGIDTTTKKPMVTGDGKPIMVLADEAGNPFKFVNPDKAGMSFDAQVNRVTQQTFGKNLYDDRFSMLTHMQMRNIETDIKMYTLMRKIEEDGIAAVAGPDELRLFRALIKDLEKWDELGQQAADAKVARLKIQDQVDNRRSNEAVAAGHAANREADAARLSDQGVAAHDEVVNIDIQLGDAMLVLTRMQDDLGLLGSSSAEINELAEQTRRLVTEGERIGRQKTVRGELLSKRDSIIEEAVGYQKQADDVQKLLEDLDRLRPELERVIGDDIGPQPAPASRMQPRTVESDLVAAREAIEPAERAYDEALAVHTAAVEAVEAAEAAYEANVYKALGARPAAKRTAAVAKELETRAARTAIPDIDVDPMVQAARGELADAEAGLRVVERDQQELWDRIAAIEASPGFAEEGTKTYNAARLATAPLYTVGERGLSVKNPLVHTKDGAVRRGALRARQDMLTEKLRVASDELDEAIINGTDDALERDLTRTIPNRPDTPEVRARTAEIKRLKEEITRVRAERDWLQTQSKKGPFPTAELTGRPGAATANARAVKRAIEARKIERPTSKYTVARKELKDAEAALKAAKSRLRTQTTNKTVKAAEGRVATAKRALAEVPREEPTFRPEGVGRVDEPVTPTPGRTLRQTNTALRGLRKELRGSLFADAADRRAQAALQGRRWEGLRYRAADRKKIVAKRGKVAKARQRLDAERSNEAITKTFDDAKRLFEAHTQRSAAKEAVEALGREVEEVRGQAAGMMGTRATKTIPAGRLPAAQQRVQTAAKAATEEEGRALRSGGPVVIVGKTDPRVRDPRLFAVGPEGEGLIRIPRETGDELGPDFILLRAKRAQEAGTENAWKFTHLVTDLLQARPGQRTTMGARIMRDVRSATSPGRASRRQRGWRFFDEDVAEGSTRVSGEAAEARRAATEAARPLREATEGAAEAQRVMGGPVPPRPEVPATTYADRPALTKAFEQQMRTAKSMLSEVQHQLKIVAASLFRFAEDDVTSQAMRELRNLLDGMKRGVVGAEGLTASARVNRYMRNVSELDRLQKAVDFERTLGVDKLPDVERRLGLLNEEIARIGRERGVATELEDLVPGQPGMQRRVPVLSQEQLATLQGQQEIVDDLAKRAKTKLDQANKFEARAVEAERLAGKHWDRVEKYQADILAIEAGALARALEQEVAIYSQRMSASAGRGVAKKRIDETVERLDRDGPFMLKSSNKDVITMSEGVMAERAALGVTDRAPLTEGKRAAVDRSLRDILDTAYSVEPSGYSPTSAKGKLFALDARERKLAQEYLKSSLSTNEWGPWTLSQGHPFKEDMQAVIRAFAKVNDPTAWDGSTGLWKMWDNFQTYLKASMIATPGFVSRNIFGAFFNAWVDDVNPAEIMRSMHMTFAVAKRARDEGIGFYSAAKKMAAAETERLRTLRHPLAKEAQPNRFKQYVELLDVGVRGGGQAVHSVELEIGLRNAMDLTLLVGGKGRNPATAVSLAPWSPRFAPYQGIRSVNSWVEDIVRLGVGMDTMRWGGSVDDALKRIAKSQFDYDELTQFERTWMRRFFPFYTWTRKNVPYQLEQLARNPAKYNKILAGKRNLELGTKEEDIVPDYFLEPFGVRLPIQFKGATVYSAPDFPFQDLARYDPFDSSGGGPKKVFQNVASAMTPILKAPLETAFGKQMYNGVPFTGRFQLAPQAISKFPGMSQALQGIGWMKKGPAGEWKMRDHHIYLVTNMLPSLGFLRRIAPNEPKYQRAYLRTLMSTIGGVSASFNTDEAKNNWLTNLRYERQEDRQEWKDMTSQTR